jgi:glycine/D-amino acid oxidase-like deaminating enzyme
MHAYEACVRGYDVVHLEREAGPRGASVRNFGLVWVSGRADGAELALARRARGRWAEIAADVPGVGFRPRGSITVVRDEAEAAVAKDAAAGPHAAQHGFSFLDADEVRKTNPALRGDFLGGLLSTEDGSVEPGRVLGAVRERLAAHPGYSWLPGRQAVELEDGASSSRWTCATRTCR